MSDIFWNQVGESNPPDGVVVEVITAGGHQRELIFENPLWWLPDMSTYVYFVPLFWRFKED